MRDSSGELAGKKRKDPENPNCKRGGLVRREYRLVAGDYGIPRPARPHRAVCTHPTRITQEVPTRGTQDPCLDEACAPRRPEYEATFSRVRQRTGRLSRRNKDSVGSPACVGWLQVQPSPRERVHAEHPEAVRRQQSECPASWEHALHGDQQEEAAVPFHSQQEHEQEDIG